MKNFDELRAQMSPERQAANKASAMEALEALASGKCSLLCGEPVVEGLIVCLVHAERCVPCTRLRNPEQPLCPDCMDDVGRR
jgi:hypothetical protein